MCFRLWLRTILRLAAVDVDVYVYVDVDVTVGVDADVDDEPPLIVSHKWLMSFNRPLFFVDMEHSSFSEFHKSSTHVQSQSDTSVGIFYW